MENIDIMKARHSVRQYEDKPVPEEIKRQIIEKAAMLNDKSGLNTQLFFNEPECFKAAKPHYGNFVGARNYFVIVGKRDADLEERAGYYGEDLVLFLQSLGLGSCWVALTHGKTKAVVQREEKQVIVVAFGYGKTPGVQHKSRPVETLCSVTGEMPDWFKTGMEAACLSPTAMNQQKFLISWDGEKLSAKVKGLGVYTKLDLGIVKHDFELASGHKFDE
jgi:nitroreductase